MFENLKNLFKIQNFLRYLKIIPIKNKAKKETIY